MQNGSQTLSAEFVTTRVTLRGLEEEPVTAHVAETGSGRPVVFLHGLAGLNDHWEEVVLRLRDQCRCLLLQLPLLQLRGEDCSIDGVTELTARFLRAHLKSPAVLVGNSFGGHVALRVALEHPDLVNGLVLAGSSGLIERSIVRDVQLRPSREWLTRKIAELFHDPDTHMREADVDRAFAELSDRGCARAMVRLSKSARRNHLGERIGLIRAPTLLVWGCNDVVTPPEAAHEFHQHIPNSRLVWFEECGHAPMIEKPAEFADALREFLERLGPGRHE